MQFKSSQIATIVNGTIEGDAGTVVSSFGKIEEAQKDQLAFLANPKYEEYLYSTKASIIIINEIQEVKQPLDATLIRVPDAYSAFASILATYEQMMTAQMTGIQQPAYINATAKLGGNVFVGAFTY